MRYSLRPLKSHQPLLVQQGIWLIQSGKVALFAVAVQKGQPQGVRRYVCTLSSGEAIFGYTGPSMAYSLLAVALQPTQLLPLAKTDLSKLLASPEGVALVDNWVMKLTNGLEPVPPGSVFKTDATRNPSIAFELTLADGQIFQPPAGQVSWLQVQQGTACCLGLSELSLNAGALKVPLSERVWLQAVGEVSLSLATTTALCLGQESSSYSILNKSPLAFVNSPVVEPVVGRQTLLQAKKFEALLVGLNQLQTYLLSYLKHRTQQEVQEEKQRFQARQELHQQTAETALDNLAGVLQSSRLTSVQGPPLLIAVTAVVQALRVTIRSSAPHLENISRLRDPIAAIAQACRLRVRQVLLRGTWWQRDNGPLLAYVKGQADSEHSPVALLPLSPTHYQLFNPVTKTRQTVDAKLARTIEPLAYVFYRPLLLEKVKSFNLTLFALQGRTQDLLLIGTTAIIITLLGMIIPQATAILMDTVIPDNSPNLLLQLGLGLLASAFGSALFQITQGFTITRFETGVEATMQAGVWDRLLNLPTSFFRQHSAGDLQARLSAVQQIRQILGANTLRSLFTSFFAFLNLGLLAIYSLPLAQIALGIALIAILVTILSGLLILRQLQPLLKLQGELSGLMVQLLNGVSKLRIAGAEQLAFGQWTKQYSQQVRHLLTQQMIEDGLLTFNRLLPNLTIALIFWIAVGLVQGIEAGNQLSTGTFLAFNAALGIFIGGVTNLSSTFVNVLEVIPLWQRAKVILDAKPEVDLTKAAPGKLAGKVTIKHVTFRYQDDAPLILNNISIHAEPGEFIALVGPSGSGKSTLFRLLLGFEPPVSGSVYYDDQDLAGLDLVAVRRQIGVVLQNSRLTSGSIFDIIAGGAVITLEEAWEAARMAAFADDVKAMPMGMQTVINEGGSNLSGGQRQRLMIARALVLKPKILLFDEATSALDNRTQEIIRESLEQLQATRFVIAHRLSTIRHAERIYVLQAGLIVQQGFFADLIQQQGLFSELMTRQMA